jgi:hypothetical protein
VVDYYSLDKTFAQGTVYQTPPDRFFVIRKIGTDQTADTFLKIDGVDTGSVISEIAPLHKTESNLLGPLDLGDLYYVVPPDKTFTVEGPAGAKIRAIGQIGRLAAGEGIPASYASRFTEQGKHYISYMSGSVSLATDETWAADREVEVLSLTPKTIETFRLNSYAGVSITGDTVADGDFGVIFYLEGTPLDILTAEPGKKGIDALSMPKPPADTTEIEKFSLEALPIEVLGDHTLKITAMNVSGADKAPAAGAAWTVDLITLYEYLKK